MNKPSSDRYSDDAPIRSHAEDRFSRWAFAERVAGVIASRQDSSSLVLGIYGPWGDGKTSVLNMMAAELEKHDDVVVIHFNPWHFESEGQLIRGLFGTLADRAGKSLATKGEQFGDVLKRYSGILSMASIALGGTIQVNPGEGLERLGEQLSSVELGTLKDRLDALLIESGKRLVILIDDLDRLDRTDIHLLLKLVKLSASFANTAYVIACDDEMIAASLGERYGSGDVQAGRQFMEKIIQVPLHLPNAETDDLQALAFEGVQAVLDQNGIEIRREDAEAFASRFVKGILPALVTPRQIKRYINSIRFAVPLLKDEVNVAEQLLIEGIRVAYPNLYLAIRNGQATFTGRAGHLLHREKDKADQQARLDSALESVGLVERPAVRALLEDLFPRTSNMGYGSDWDPEWAKEQRIASSEYFRRYFQYSVPRRDVSDQLIGSLGDAASAGDTHSIGTFLKAISDQLAWSRALDKMFAALDSIDSVGLHHLAVELAAYSPHLPDQRGGFSEFLAPMRRAAGFVEQAIARLPVGERLGVSQTVLSKSDLVFANECFRWLRMEPKKPIRPTTLSSEEITELGTYMAQRIGTALSQGDPSSFESDLGRLLWVWKEYQPKEASTFFEGRFNNDPMDAIRFLGTFVGRAWRLDSGLSGRARFERNSYDSAVFFVQPELILSAIDKVFPGRKEHYSFESMHELKGDEQVACGFVAVHNHVLNENANAGAVSQVSEAPATQQPPSTPSEDVVPIPKVPKVESAKAKARRKPGARR